jgi:hypothetical protein
MTTFLTASRTPTIGDFSAQCQLNKGMPLGWYTGRTGYVVGYIAAKQLGITVPLGAWEYQNCACQIDCSVAADATVSGPAAAAGDPSWSNSISVPVKEICPSVNELVFDARVNSPSTSDPLEFLLTFTDVFGNIRILSIYILRWVIPLGPTLALEAEADPGTQWEPGQKPDTLSVKVTVPFTTSSGSIKDKTEAYQVQRYVDHEGSKTLLRDWKENDFYTSPDNTVRDFLVLPNRTYGYRVRYKAGEGDATVWSPWATVTT